MILLTLADLLLLTFIAGLMGALIFPALLLGSGFNYGVIKFVTRIILRQIKEQGDREGQIEKGLEPEELLKTNKKGDFEQSEKSEAGSEENDVEENPEETPQSFHSIAALSATWLPCVVGEQKEKLFLVSGVTSLVFKVLLLLLAVSLADSGLQPHIYERPFLLFCFNEHSPVLNKTGITPCKYSEDQCRPPTNLINKTKIAEALSAVEMAVLQYKRILTDIDDDNLEKLNIASEFLSHVITSKAEIHEALESAGMRKMQQRIRICEENETPFLLCILFGLLVVILLAAYATYRLHRIADYQVKLPLFIDFSFQTFLPGTLQLLRDCAGMHTLSSIQSHTSFADV